MNEKFARTELLIGKTAAERLKNSSVLLFGVGGVGSYTLEALVRCGIGKISIVDGDTVDITNINRQLIATSENIGQLKTEAAKKRALSVNPELDIRTYPLFITKDNIDMFDFTEYDYIADAIDTVSSKLAVIEKAARENVKIISCMGAGNKLDPTKFEVSDIYKTSVCPLARVMRYELKKRGIKKLNVVYSQEMPKTYEHSGKKPIPGSISFVPSAAGLVLAGKIIRDIADI